PAPQRPRRRTAGARRAAFFVRPFDFDRTAVVAGRLTRLRLPLPVGSKEALFAESPFAESLFAESSFASDLAASLASDLLPACDSPEPSVLASAGGALA